MESYEIGFNICFILEKVGELNKNYCPFLSTLNKFHLSSSVSHGAASLL